MSTGDRDVPRYEIKHGDVTVEAVVVRVDGKTIVQPISPVVVHSGESFEISGGGSTVTLGAGEPPPAHDRMLHAHLHGDGPPVTPLAEPHEHPHGHPGAPAGEHTHPHRHAPMIGDGTEARR